MLFIYPNQSYKPTSTAKSIWLEPGVEAAVEEVGFGLECAFPISTLIRWSIPIIWEVVHFKMLIPFDFKVGERVEEAEEVGVNADGHHLRKPLIIRLTRHSKNFISLCLSLIETIGA